MKKYIIISFFFFHLSLHSISQVYQPFPGGPGAIWREFYIHHSGPIDRIEDRYSFTTGYDTIIQGKTYTTLWKNGVSTEYNQNNQVINEVIEQETFAGAIREDSTRKIYYWANGENLLYDFSLNVNDSLLGNYLWNLPTSTYVSSIDSIFDGNIYRKQYHISEANVAIDYIQLIEGIGSTWGLLNFFGALGPTWGNLYCFQDGPSNLILDTAQCIASSIAESPNVKNQISVYPNPSSSKVYIEGSTMKIDKVEVYDLSNHLMSCHFGYDANYGIDISTLPTGLYIIKVFSTFSISILKVIKS